MIKNYHDDAEMARYGRMCSKHKAIKQAKEQIRDNSVRIMNSNDVDEINQFYSEIKTAMTDLMEAIEIDV
jgi:hypothetical protein